MSEPAALSDPSAMEMLDDGLSKLCLVDEQHRTTGGMPDVVGKTAVDDKIAVGDMSAANAETTVDDMSEIDDMTPIDDTLITDGTKNTDDMKDTRDSKCIDDVDDVHETAYKASQDKPTLQTLPLEIKHEIFSHLLLGSKVQYVARAEGTKIKKFNFQTAILRVNKHLGHEATVYLHTCNNFAAIVTQWSGFDQMVQNACLPAISLAPTSQLLHPAILVSIELHETPCTCGGEGCGNLPKPTTNRSLCMLVEDLPLLISELQISYYLAFPGNNNFILSSPQEDKVRSASHIEELTALLELRVEDNLFIDLGPEEREVRQRKLLTPFTCLQNRCQEVKITGDVLPRVAEDIMKTMMPKVAWLKAAGWDLYDVILNRKERLDKLVGNANPRWLFMHYQRIGCFAYSENALFTRQVGEDKSLALATLPSGAALISKSWQLAVVVAGLDCMVTAAGLAMRIGQEQLVRNIAALACDAMDVVGIPREAIPSELNAIILHYLGIGILGVYGHETPGRTEALHCLEHALTYAPDDKHLLYDADLLRKVCSGDDLWHQLCNDAVGLILTSLPTFQQHAPSANTIKFARWSRKFKISKRKGSYNTALAADVDRPASLKGWIDTAHEITPDALHEIVSNAIILRSRALAERETLSRQAHHMRALLEIFGNSVYPGGFHGYQGGENGAEWEGLGFTQYGDGLDLAQFGAGLDDDEIHE
ncbi:hypothetical protein MBLNU459_g2411t1 [Dothideomycetes sp. NU459]